MPIGETRARGWVMGRGQWIDASLRSLEGVITPLTSRLLEDSPDRKPWRSKALGAQAGALMGYVSRKVLGQYDVFLPPDDEGLLYFVGPNVLEIEQRFGFEPRDFRLWLCLHEVTHRVQFTAAPWMRGHLRSMVNEYFTTIELDPKRLVENLKRATGDLAGGGEISSLVTAVMTPEQRVLFTRMQAMMALLEGHASFVMNDVGREQIPTIERLRAGLGARRNVGSLERTFQKAIGFDQKIAQYGTGERFVQAIVAEAGMETFNRVWTDMSALPTTEEIASPPLWLARMG